MPKKKNAFFENVAHLLVSGREELKRDVKLTRRTENADL